MEQPFSRETIPQMELLGALTLAKLMVDQGHKGKQYKQFVHNRLVQIRDLFSGECWRYCPSASNPAEIASRGAKCPELKTNELWWNGLSFLVEERR